MKKRFLLKNRSARRLRRRRVLERLETRRLLAGAEPEVVRPIPDLTIQAGVPFSFNTQPGGTVAFGLDVGGIDLRATDNYFASNVSFLKHFQDVTFTGNTVVTSAPWRVTQLNDLPRNFQPSEHYTWDNNAYFSNNSKPFIVDGPARTWDQWRSQTGLDSSSQLDDAATGTFSVVRPNDYEPGRGHAVVYNWDRLSEVVLDLAEVVDVGANYRIYNVLDLKGDAVVTGLFDGSPVTVPMIDMASPVPIGHAPAAPLNTGNEFGAFLILSDADPVAASGTEFYVSVTGTPDGDGSLSNPWDLATAMSHPSSVQPGDTIWLRGGTYVGAFTSHLSGTAAAPIDVREFPGEEVIVDLNNGSPLRSEVITIEGRHTHFQGFEIFSSDPSARLTAEPGSWPAHINRGNINIYGDHVKFINMEIHDLNKGVGFWSRASGGEVYGSLIYNNGWIGPDRNHGHAIYSQNQGDMRRFVDNMMFNQFRNGLKVYGSASASLKNHYLEGNVSFNNGAAEGEGFSGTFQYLIGGGQDAENIELTENFSYVGTRYFGDADAGEMLTLAARRVGGASLPSWLTFHAGEGFFVGSPGPGDQGTVSVELTATDPTGMSVTEVFDITVRAANAAPQVVTAIPDTQVALGELFELGVADHFADSDPQDSLIFSAAPLQGGVLPSWMSIDPESGVISGTPVESGTFSLDVTAYDDGGKFVTETFDLTVAHNAGAVGADLRIRLQDAADPVPSGQPVEYSISVTNLGPGVARNVQATIQLPAESQFVSTSPQCSHANGTVSCQLSDITALTTVNVSIIATASALGLLTSQASVTSDTTDLVLSNNSDSQSTFVNGIPIADDDAVTVSENALAAVVGNLVHNDLDPNPSDVLRVTEVQTQTTPGTLSGQFGQLVWDADGEFTYTVESNHPQVNGLGDGQSLLDVFPYKVADNHGGSSSASLVVTVAGANDAPMISSSIPDVTVGTAEPLSLNLLSHFFDVDAGDTLTIAAELAGNASLPSWLQLNETTGVLRKSSSPAEASTYSIQVTASDVAGQSTDQSFTLSVNDPPTVTAIPGVEVNEDEAVEFSVAGFFTEPNAPQDWLSFTATTSDGSPLPSWLGFDGTDATFSGVATNDDLGGSQIKVTAHDQFGGAVFGDFELVVRNTNDPPILTSPILDQAVIRRQGLSVDLSAHFHDIDPGDSLTYAAEQSDGSALPDWLTLNSVTGQLTGTSDTPTQVSLRVTASDTAGASTSDGFDLEVQQGVLQHAGGGQLRVALDSSGTEIQLFDNGVLIAGRPLEQTDFVDLTGSIGAADSLTVDFINGSPIPADGLSWDGGDIADSDSIAIVGGQFDGMTVQFESVVGQGRVLFGDASTWPGIEFTRVTTVASTSTVNNLALSLGPLDDAATLTNAGRGAAALVHEDGRRTEFRTPTGSLDVRGQAGSDTIISGPLTLAAADLILDAESVIVTGRVLTAGGDVQSRGSSFLSHDRASISTAGGKVMLLHNQVYLGDSVTTAGGAFTSEGSGEFVAIDSGAKIRTSGRDFAGQVRIEHTGDVTLDAVTTGGADLDVVAGGNVHYRGNLDVRGPAAGHFASSGVEFVLNNGRRVSTGGGDVILEHSGRVSLGEGVTTLGGAFLSSGDGEFVAADTGASIRTNGRLADGDVVLDHSGDVTLFDVTTGGGLLDISSEGDVWIRGKINTGGIGPRHFRSSGNSFTSSTGKTILTGGGDIKFEHLSVVSIGGSLQTGGGHLRSRGESDFIVPSTASIMTQGRSSDGNVDLEHGGKIVINRVVTGGGNIDLTAGQDVELKGRVDTKGGSGGNFTSIGEDFVSRNGAAILTGGGMVELRHHGIIRVGESIQTSGGDFFSIGSGSFTSVDTGSSIRTAGGTVSLAHPERIWLGGGVSNAGGNLNLALAAKPTVVPAVEMRGRLELPAGSTVIVDLDGQRLGDLFPGPLPIEIPGFITFGSFTGQSPADVDVVNTHADDPPLHAQLVRGSGNQLNLVFSESAPLAAAGGGLPSTHNSLVAEDVNHDGRISALDALIIINSLSAPAAAPPHLASMSSDVNDDGLVSAIDALLVINALRPAFKAAEAEMTGPWNSAGLDDRLTKEQDRMDDAHVLAADQIAAELAPGVWLD